jgi:hypothetical protein
VVEGAGRPRHIKSSKHGRKRTNLLLRSTEGCMAHFRVIRVRACKSGAASEDGWAVERTALGQIGGVVSRVFPSREDAKAEAQRLRAQEVKETGS